MSDALRETGIQAVGAMPWGTHFCQFYRSQADLVETLVPYFDAGLRNGEACLWITSEPLHAEEAEALMIDTVPEFRDAIARDQIAIKDLADWYVPGTRFDAGAVLDGWLRCERDARANGYAGLRLTGNTSWVPRPGWDDFMSYEDAVDAAFRRRHILALCTYDLERCTADDVMDVARRHEFALARRGGEWEVLEHGPLQRAREDLRRANASLARRVRERTEELEQALRARDDFLAMLGHELRNPLAPIRNAATVISRLAPEHPHLQQMSVVLERQVGHLSRLVDDLLDVARITRGVLALDVCDGVELQTVIAAALETVGPQIAARGQQLDVMLPAQTLSLRADPVRLTQMISNLLDNATKYTPDGGHIALTLAEEDGDAVLTVRDDGHGIAADVLLRIFDPFAQGPRALDRQQGGLGIGLTLVRRLVELHGGAVHAHSDGLGRGATFALRLPLAPRGAAALWGATPSA